MKKEYQTTIALVKEILAANGDAATPIIDRLVTRMVEVFPLPQNHRDPENAEMMVKERDLVEEILRKRSPFTDVLAVPADDFLPQLYPLLVFKLLLRDYAVNIDVNKIENFSEFYSRYGYLIIFDRDDLHRKI